VEYAGNEALWATWDRRGGAWHEPTKTAKIRGKWYRRKGRQQQSEAGEGRKARLSEGRLRKYSSGRGAGVGGLLRAGVAEALGGIRRDKQGNLHGRLSFIGSYLVIENE